MTEQVKRTEHETLFIESLRTSVSDVSDEALNWMFKYGYVGQEGGPIIRFRNDQRANHPIQMAFKGNEISLKIINTSGVGSISFINRFDTCKLKKTEEGKVEGIIFMRNDGGSLFINSNAEYILREAKNINSW